MKTNPWLWYGIAAAALLISSFTNNGALYSSSLNAMAWLPQSLGILYSAYPNYFVNFTALLLYLGVGAIITAAISKANPQKEEKKEDA